MSKVVEEWRLIPGSDGYQVSSLGRVAGPRGRIKACDNGHGYRKVKLSGQHQKQVHRLVGEVFLGPIPKGWVVAHKNGLKTDNRLANLQVTTRKGNAMHKVYHLASGRGCPAIEAAERTTSHRRRLIGQCRAALRGWRRRQAQPVGIFPMPGERRTHAPS